MYSETKAKISKVLYHLSTENRASANRELREIIDQKVAKAFDREYQKVKASFSKEK